MVTLIDKLGHLYPTADPLLFGVSDDGTGQKITNWAQPFPKPTHPELDNIVVADVENNIYDTLQQQNRRAEYNSDQYRSLQGHVQREETPLQDLKDETDRIRAKFPYSDEV